MPRPRHQHYPRRMFHMEHPRLGRVSTGRRFALAPDADSRGFDETAYLNSTAANRAALARSLKEAATGKSAKVDL